MSENMECELWFSISRTSLSVSHVQRDCWSARRVFWTSAISVRGSAKIGCGGRWLPRHAAPPDLDAAPPLQNPYHRAIELTRKHESIMHFRTRDAAFGNAPVMSKLFAENVACSRKVSLQKRCARAACSSYCLHAHASVITSLCCSSAGGCQCPDSTRLDCATIGAVVDYEMLLLWAINAAPTVSRQRWFAVRITIVITPIIVSDADYNSTVLTARTNYTSVDFKLDYHDPGCNEWFRHAVKGTYANVPWSVFVAFWTMPLASINVGSINLPVDE